MSINSCSINEHTIDSLCGSRRAATIDWLLTIETPEPPVVTGGGSVQQVGYGVRNPHIYQQPDRRESERVDVRTIEMPHIMVSVTSQGVHHSQTLERDDPSALPLVTARKFTIADGQEEPINITVTGLSITHKFTIADGQEEPIHITVTGLSITRL